MTDIVERLRGEADMWVAEPQAAGEPQDIMREAADEIERLRTERDVEVERWKAALETCRELRKRNRDEIERLTEQLHYANGTCDLAMKHRDAAEAEIERLREALKDARVIIANLIIANYWRLSSPRLRMLSAASIAALNTIDAALNIHKRGET